MKRGQAVCISYIDSHVCKVTLWLWESKEIGWTLSICVIRENNPLCRRKWERFLYSKWICNLRPCLFWNIFLCYFRIHFLVILKYISLLFLNIFLCYFCRKWERFLCWKWSCNLSPPPLPCPREFYQLFHHNIAHI